MVAMSVSSEDEEDKEEDGSRVLRGEGCLDDDDDGLFAVVERSCGGPNAVAVGSATEAIRQRSASGSR